MVEIEVARSIGILYSLKYLLSKDVLIQLYDILVHSHFIYGLAVCGSTFSAYVSKLHRLQNKAIRIVTESSRNESVTLLRQVLKILLLPLLFRFSTAKFVLLP